MATRKTSTGSTPKSKRIVAKKMATAMDEFKQHKLKSGSNGATVKSRKQAVAIGLSEARKAGADIPPSPSRKE